MKFINKLTPVALATAMAFGGMAVPMVSQAGISSDATISSMYLWRGQDISASGPVLSGDLGYTHSSGAYVNLWISSFGVISQDAQKNLTYSTESDWTVGYNGSVGDFGYGISYYRFWYPESDHTGLGKASGEYVLSGSYKGADLTVYRDATNAKTYTYSTLSYGMGAFSGTLGYESENVSANNYKHIDLSYAATDRLSFTVSKRFALGANQVAAGMGEDPLFMISYSLPVDLK